MEDGTFRKDLILAQRGDPPRARRVRTSMLVEKFL